MTVNEGAEEAISRFNDVLIAERELRRAQQRLDVALAIMPESQRAFYYAETTQLRMDFEALPASI
jgi:hypothetical protein